VNGPPARGGRPAAVLGVVLVLGAFTAGGFLAQRLLRPRATLYPTPPAAHPVPPPPAPEARTIPAQVPDIALPGPDGHMHHLSEWRGRPLLINFWATWCEPCRREIPLLKSLRHERQADGLEVVGIAVDEAAAVRRYARERGIDYPLLIGEQGGLAAASAFGMDTVLPFSVFADRSGDVVALKVGEMHPEEARFILDRLRQVDEGSLTLPAAREAISAGLARLSAARAGSVTH